uniref:Uncharacterized protein n=1 Tax=viral metagenome TaxID=1070528 RepID=A0A6H1ZWI3_9ZZZZ
MKTKTHGHIQYLVWRALVKHWETKKKFDYFYDLREIINNMHGLKKQEKYHANTAFTLELRTQRGYKKTAKQIEEAYAEHVADEKRRDKAWGALAKAKIKEEKDIAKSIKRLEKKDPGFFIQK